MLPRLVKTKVQHQAPLLSIAVAPSARPWTPFLRGGDDLWPIKLIEACRLSWRKDDNGPGVLVMLAVP